MNKEAFLRALRAKLSGLDREDIERSVEYYSEMIDDRIEDGYTEEAAVRAMGRVQDAADRIFADCSIIKETTKKITRVARESGGRTALLIISSPIWVPLLIALGAVVFSLTVALGAVVFSLVISLFAADIALFASSLALALGGVMYIFNGFVGAAVAALGGAITVLGLAILLLIGCKAFAKEAIKLIRSVVIGIKKIVIKKF